MTKGIPEFTGVLRAHIVEIPQEIYNCSGILIFGKRIKSLVFTTDVAIIKNCNADAVIAVYPFTPQPVISRSVIEAADMPVLCGVGGGTTTGHRVLRLAQEAEFQGAFGVVVNAPTKNEIIGHLKNLVDIPVIVTVVSEETDVRERIEAGADILNVSGAAKTPAIVQRIREDFPEIPIIATGGTTPESIRATIDAGANAITYTPPTSAELFRVLMDKYRDQAATEGENLV